MIGLGRGRPAWGQETPGQLRRVVAGSDRSELIEWPVGEWRGSIFGKNWKQVFSVHSSSLLGGTRPPVGDNRKSVSGCARGAPVCGGGHAGAACRIREEQ